MALEDRKEPGTVPERVAVYTRPLRRQERRQAAVALRGPRHSSGSRVWPVHQVRVPPGRHVKIRFTGVGAFELRSHAGKRNQAIDEVGRGRFSNQVRRKELGRKSRCTQDEERGSRGSTVHFHAVALERDIRTGRNEARTGPAPLPARLNDRFDLACVWPDLRCACDRSGLDQPAEDSPRALPKARTAAR